MKAIVITRPGDLDSLEVREVATPEAQADRVRVRVRACGLNRADLLQAKGHYPPPPRLPADIPGLEFAGEVEPRSRRDRSAQGRRSGLRDRRRRRRSPNTSSVPERMLVPIPANLDFESAAAVPEAFITAQDALETRGAIRPGDRVLIHAVGGGVGSAAVQVAHAMGCEVFGTSRTAEKLEKAKELGPRRRDRHVGRGLRRGRPRSDRRGGASTS